MREFKVGDKVRWVLYPGRSQQGVIESIALDGVYPLRVRFDEAIARGVSAQSFTFAGRYVINDPKPTLFHVKEEEEETKKETTMISMDKKYTFKGQHGRLLAIDRPGPRPVVWMKEDGTLFTFTEDGGSMLDKPVRLQEVKPEKWVNVYPDEEHESKERADKLAGTDRIACVKFTEGEGL